MSFRNKATSNDGEIFVVIQENVVFVDSCINFLLETSLSFACPSSLEHFWCFDYMSA